MGFESRLRLQADPRRAPEFECFVKESAARLLRVSYLLVGDFGAAEDLLQLTLLRTARRWRAAQRAPEAYARQVLINLVRDRHRRASRRLVEHPVEGAIGRDLHDVLADQAELVAGRDEVVAALAKLTADQREVLVLRFYADLSVMETAAAAGISAGTVKSRTSRALARMRELLADPPTASSQRISVEVADDHRRAAH